MPPRACPRGSHGDLHTAADSGDFVWVRSLLSERSDGIDQGDAKGQTPLMIAAAKGLALICLFLIGKGANPSMESVEGTALLAASQNGYLDVVKVLLSGGAYMESTTSTLNSTALHLAAQRGHLDVVRELVSAGANVDCRRSDGATPLISAATKGQVQIIRHLLRAKANPLLSMGRYNTLDVGAQHDQPGVVRELIEHVGLARCGGPTGGVHALDHAAHEEGVESMALLVGAGVVDTGQVLHHAVDYGREKAVKLLVQKWGGAMSAAGRYVDTRDKFGYTPLIKSIYGDVDTSLARPRIVRLLVDARADTSSAVRLTDKNRGVVFDGTPLALANMLLRYKNVSGKPASERLLRRLEAVRRVLLQVQAIRSVPWVWPSGAPVPRKSNAAQGTVSPPGMLTATVPVLRRRARRRGVVLASLFRWVLLRPPSALRHPMPAISARSLPATAFGWHSCSLPLLQLFLGFKEWFFGALNDATCPLVFVCRRSRAGPQHSFQDGNLGESLGDRSFFAQRCLLSGPLFLFPPRNLEALSRRRNGGSTDQQVLYNPVAVCRVPC